MRDMEGTELQEGDIVEWLPDHLDSLFELTRVQDSEVCIRMRAVHPEELFGWHHIVYARPEAVRLVERKPNWAKAHNNRGGRS